ncbi:hypothetical protein [Streptomyces sp. NBC_00057]|uniref:hypothetical protein n=1 Tax=Streptomyces sp. NBC_00057 TaxID=2975634 RepID=UPI00386513A1
MARVNDEANFGEVFDEVFANKVEERVGLITDLGKRYFALDKGFRSSLNRSARRAAWRMIRREEGVDEAA